jgi:hypothetical protein
MDWTPFPLPDGSYADHTREWTDQDIVNYLPTKAERSGTRTAIKYACVPGLNLFVRVGTGPHRGAEDVEGKLFVVSGTVLYQIGVTGTATVIGTIPGTGFVSMTHNQIDGGNELLIGTFSTSYVYNTVTGVLTNTGIALFSVDFLNQRFLGVDPLRRFWRYSGLASGTSWNDLDNEDAESSPDRIVGGKVSQSEWLVFGGRTIEVWPNNPNDTSAFPQRGTVIEKGCANANTICRLDNTLYFLGNDYIVYKLQGYTPIPVSPKALTEVFAASNPDKAFAFTYEDNGYVIYYLTFQDGQTWGFDVTNQQWHRRESFGLDRWRLNTLLKWNNDWYGGDYSDGRLYRLDWRYALEGCELLPRRIRTGVIHNNGNRISVAGLRVMLATGGVVSTPGAPLISGDLPAGETGDEIDYSYVIVGCSPVCTITAGALPTGLSMGADGVITGTMSAAGAFAWAVTVTDVYGSSTLDDTCTVVPALIITGTLPDGVVGSAYSHTLTVSQGVPPYSGCTISSGALPPGLSISLSIATITVSGTPA